MVIPTDRREKSAAIWKIAKPDANHACLSRFVEKAPIFTNRAILALAALFFPCAVHSLTRKFHVPASAGLCTQTMHRCQGLAPLSAHGEISVPASVELRARFPEPRAT
jgi:hypothetical protein